MWFLKKLRNNKEYTPSPTREQTRVEPLAATPAFNLPAALASAEEEVIALLVDGDESETPAATTASFPPASSSPPPAPSPSPTTPLTAPRKRDAPHDHFNYRNAKRARQRESKIAAVGHVPAPGSTAQLLGSTPKGIESPLDTSSLPAAYGGYFAKPARHQDIDWNKTYTLTELLDLGLVLVKWDGVTPIPIYDSEGNIFAVLAGRPNDASYVEDADKAFALMRLLAENEVWKENELLPHRRGTFIAHNVGISGGKGSPSPVKLSVGTHAYLTERLLGSKSIQRLAAFGSSSFQRWSPNLFAYYKEHMDTLRAHSPHLGRNFAKSVFPCAAFNMTRASESVESWKHRDSTNLPFGWCSIMSIAKKGYRPHLGGHIVLWELGLVIEFPHASTVLIPSATVTHSNAAVADGDERMSFTQFAAGALFRYVDYGFRSEKQLLNRDRKEFRRQEVLRSTRWEMGLSLYSKLTDLLECSTN